MDFTAPTPGGGGNVTIRSGDENPGKRAAELIPVINKALDEITRESNGSAETWKRRSIGRPNQCVLRGRAMNGDPRRFPGGMVTAGSANWNSQAFSESTAAKPTSAGALARLRTAIASGA